MASLDQAWRHRWQVVRLIPGALAVCCSHRWEWSAETCARLRATFGPTPTASYDLRETPEVARG